MAGDGSYVADYYEYDIKYFREYGPAVNVIVGAELELWQESERHNIDTFIKKLEASEYFQGKEFTVAWTRDFSSFIGTGVVVTTNSSSLLNVFLQNYNDYKLDIKLDSGKIKYSRFFVSSKNMNTSIRESHMMLKVREIAG